MTYHQGRIRRRQHRWKRAKEDPQRTRACAIPAAVPDHNIVMAVSIEITLREIIRLDHRASGQHAVAVGQADGALGGRALEQVEAASAITG